MSELNLLEGVQQTFYIVCRLVLQHLDAAFHLKRNKRTMSTEILRLSQPRRDGLMWSHRCMSACLTSILEDLLKAPLGWTWSYRMMTPTMTLMQNKSVSSLLKRLEYSLNRQKADNAETSYKIPDLINMKVNFDPYQSKVLLGKEWTMEALCSFFFYKPLKTWRFVCVCLCVLTASPAWLYRHWPWCWDSLLCSPVEEYCSIDPW